jgi:predicted permease
MLQLLRYALRQLRNSLAFAVTAVLALALGIGASTAIFAVINGLLLQPLPFAQPNRLVAVTPQPDGVASIPTMKDYLSRSSTFADLAAYRQWLPTQNSTNAMAHHFLIVSQDFFSTLGTRFELGASWPITGDERDCSSEVVVSGAYWKRLGGGNVLGTTMLNLEGRDFQIVGVLSPSQGIEGPYGLSQPEVFVQIGCAGEEHYESRGNMSFKLIGRLRGGMTIRQANADLARVDQALQKDYPNDYGPSNAPYKKLTLVFPYLELVIGTGTKPALLMTFAACGLLLTIACANLASLLLARNTRRRTEFATRVILGASFSQLLGQLTVESAVLVSLGTAGGTGLALLALKFVTTTTAVRVPRLAHASLNLVALGFVIVVSAFVTFFLTLLPAWRTLHPRLLRDLEGVGRSSSGRSLQIAGRVLVVAQVTLTVVLAACAGWMVGGVYVLLHQPLGFRPDHLLIVHAALEPANSTKEQAKQSEARLSQIAVSLNQLPGVVSVALSDHQPLGHGINRYTFCSDLEPEQCKQQINVNPNSFAISPTYFSTIGQPLLEGRDFNASDDGRSHVVIVNQVLAAREWPGRSAIGHRIRTGEIHTSEGQTWATVIGVVANVRNYDLFSKPGPDLYIPRAEDPSGSASFILRVAGNPALLKNTVRKKLGTAFPEGTFFGFETMSEEMSSEVSERVFLMKVAISFGTIALFLSVLGTYSLLAYEVAIRKKEIGIRLALGSTRETIVKLLLYDGGRWLFGGAILGVACASAVGYFFRSRFYGMHAISLPVLAGAAFLIIGFGFLAIALPACRAAFQDPVATLRRE